MASNNNNLVSREERVWLFYLSRYFYLILLAAVLVIILVFYFFVIYPQLSKSDVLRYFSYKSEVEQLDLLNRQKSEINGIVADYNKFSADNLLELEQILPAEKDIPDLLVQLDAFARSAGLVMQSVSFNERQTENNTVISGQKQNAVNNPDVRELAITLNVRGGGYGQLKQFSQSLESNLRLMDITSFQFTEEKTGGFIINILTYFYK